MEHANRDDEEIRKQQTESGTHQNSGKSERHWDRWIQDFLAEEVKRRRTEHFGDSMEGNIDMPRAWKKNVRTYHILMMSSLLSFLRLIFACIVAAILRQHARATRGGPNIHQITESECLFFLSENHQRLKLYVITLFIHRTQSYPAISGLSA